jgi:hypothetical protein
MGFLGLLRGRALEQDERADQLVAPLDLIDTAELELGKVAWRFHRRCLPLG